MKIRKLLTIEICLSSIAARRLLEADLRATLSRNEGPPGYRAQAH